MSAEVVVVIGASAGGVGALTDLFRGFPASTRAAFFVTLHVSPHACSILPKILGACGGLKAEHPRDRRRVEPGRIYIAPPDRHLLIADGRVRLSHGPTENGHRPAVNPMFESAAETYGRRVAGVLLTGMLDDGVIGLARVKRRGGLTVVQDPEEAPFPDMPLNALAAMKVDRCLRVDAIRNLLARLAGPGGARHLRELTPGRKRKRNGSPPLKSEFQIESLTRRLGPPTAMICPSCSGPLWEVSEGGSVSYRCTVGHAFSPDSLMENQGYEIERSLWVAVRSLEERAELQKRMARRMDGGRDNPARKTFAERARENEAHARRLRGILERI